MRRACYRSARELFVSMRICYRYYRIDIESTNQLMKVERSSKTTTKPLAWESNKEWSTSSLCNRINLWSNFETWNTNTRRIRSFISRKSIRSNWRWERMKKFFKISGPFFSKMWYQKNTLYRNRFLFLFLQYAHHCGYHLCSSTICISDTWFMPTTFNNDYQSTIKGWLNVNVILSPCRDTCTISAISHTILLHEMRKSRNVSRY